MTLPPATLDLVEPETDVGRRGGDRLWRLSWPEGVVVLLALLPFVSVYAAHFAAEPHATGFIQYDVPYYSANGREIFERGNGWAYPNPYDASAESPVIYFHWLLWLVGLAIVVLGWDPGLVIVGLGGLSALAMSWTTFLLVRQVLPRPRFRLAMFLAAMWGGGILCLTRVITNGLTGQSLNHDLLAWDPGRGLWMLNWGRNQILPTEAAYHALMAGSWLFALRARWWCSLTLAAVLAATHPWSGLEALLTQAGFWSVMVVLLKRREGLSLWIASVGLLGLFLSYNLVFLDAHPQHRELHATWKLGWGLTRINILLAWAPVAWFAVKAWRSGRDASEDRPQSINLAGRGNPIVTERVNPAAAGGGRLFLLIAFGVAFLLSIHDRFIPPTQPLHFTRGYVWMPLFLLACPWLQQELWRLRERSSRSRFACVMAAVGLIAAFDNLVFVGTQVRLQSSGQAGFNLSDGERDMLQHINRQELSGVVLCEQQTLGYLSAVYTRLDPWVGHKYNTPDVTQRVEFAGRLLESGGTEQQSWPPELDWLVVSSEAAARVHRMSAAVWEPVYQNQELSLLRRRAQQTTLLASERVESRRLRDAQSFRRLEQAAPSPADDPVR